MEEIGFFQRFFNFGSRQQETWDNFNKQLPSSSGWTVYGHTYCPYAKNAVKKLKENKQTVTVIKTNGKLPTVISFLKSNGFMKNKPNHSTSPAVFHGKKLIGGYDDLSNYLK